MKNIGSAEYAQINFKGKIGYISLDMIIAPSIIKRGLGVFSKAVKQPNEDINKLNSFIKENLIKTNTIRSSVSMSSLDGLSFRLKNTKLNNVSYAYDTKIQKESFAEFALGKSDVDLTYWFGFLPSGDNLSNAFSNIDSFIYNDPFLKSLLNKVLEDYVDTTNIPKLKTSLYHELNSLITSERAFFKKAVSGPEGDTDNNNKFNIDYFFSGDPKFKILTPLYGLAELSFTGDIKTKEDYIDILNKREAVLVIEGSTGSSVKIKGKVIPNVSIGLYKKEYISRMRDAIKI